MGWLPLATKIYDSMFDMIAEAEIDLPKFEIKEAKHELIVITALLNAVGHFTKLGWDNDAEEDHSLKKRLNLKLVSAWWRLVNNNWTEEPSAETLGASDSEAYDWNRLSAIVVRFYLNRAVNEVVQNEDGGSEGSNQNVDAGSEGNKGSNQNEDAGSNQNETESNEDNEGNETNAVVEQKEA